MEVLLELGMVGSIPCMNEAEVDLKANYVLKTVLIVVERGLTVLMLRMTYGRMLGLPHCR